MNNSRIVFLISLRVSKKVGSTLISTLAILLLCASLAESHGEGCQDNGYTISHSQPRPSNAPSLRTWSLEWGGDQDGEGITENAHHRHYMTQGNAVRWRFWNIFKTGWDSDTFSNCPQQSPPQQSPPQQSPPQQSPPQQSPPQQSLPSANQNPDPLTTITEVVEEIIEDYVEEVEEDEPEIEPEPEPEPEPVTEYHELQFYGSGGKDDRDGVNFVAFPVSDRDIQRPGDIWENYDFIRELGGSLQIYMDGQWLTYGGDGQWLTTEKTVYLYSDKVQQLLLTQNMGIAITLEWSSLLAMRGVPFPRAERVTLVPGSNFVGFPVAPDGVTYISDFLDLGVEAVLTTVEGNLHVIGRSGDPGDGVLLPNTALFMIVEEPVELTFTKEVSAAPAASRVKYVRWGQLKQGR